MRGLRSSSGSARCVLLLALLVAISTTLSAESDRPPALAERIDRFLAPFVADDHLSGTLLVADRAGVIYERSFGMASHELGVPNGPETRHCVASITKPMTIVVLARLVEAGKLAREDPLSKWIPDFPRGGEITVERLARHEAGIPHRLVEESEQVSPMSAADLVEAAKRADLVFDPGTDDSYSSGGFSVLARVLELAGGMSYQELLETYVLMPAGMTGTAHADSRQILPNRASSYYVQADGSLINAPLRDLSFLVGAGSVYSTARDLLAMMRALLDGHYGEAAREALLRESGLRWNGVTHGFRAFADYHADRDLFVIVTANLQTGAISRIRKDLPRVVAGQEVDPASPLHLKVARVPPDVLESYSGSYQLRPGSLIDLHVDDGVLYANEWLLIPLSETEFFSMQEYAHVTIVFDDSGAVERLDWEIDGTVYPLPRVDAVD